MQTAATLSRSDWRVILLASLGGALEFYDFVIYSQFAQYIGRNFFPNTDAMMSLVVSFGVFAVGYFARPLGGIFFSHIGDRIGPNSRWASSKKNTSFGFSGSPVSGSCSNSSASIQSRNVE